MQNHSVLQYAQNSFYQIHCITMFCGLTYYGVQLALFIKADSNYCFNMWILAGVLHVHAQCTV